MTKRRIFLDDPQEEFVFDSPIEVYTQLREELTHAAPPAHENHTGSYEECCLEIAVAVKKAIRQSGLSRDLVVEEVNEFFGWPTAGDGRERLTIHMLNNYLCRPDSYNMPIPYLHAIQRVTGSLLPLITLAELEGAQVIAGDEIRKLSLGKIDDAINELQRLKKTLRLGNNKTVNSLTVNS